MDAVNKYSGKVRPLTGWMPNKILTSGRNIMSTTSGWAGSTSYCQVGTNSTVPVATDTGLLGWLAGTNTPQAAAYGAQSSPPYYGWWRQTYRFSAGVATGNISEAGVGWAASGSTLVSRALVVDALGVPTTVTVLFDEYLDVTYELRYYPPLVDSIGTVALDGITYNTVTRAASVTSGTAWGSRIGQGIGVVPDSFSWIAYDGALGAITVAPSGAIAYVDNSGQTNRTYINNSYNRDMQTTCGTGGWNLGLGIRCISILSTAGSYQTSFSAVTGGARIPKSTLYTMIMVWRIAWSEATIP